MDEGLQVPSGTASACAHQGKTLRESADEGKTATGGAERVRVRGLGWLTNDDGRFHDRGQ